MGHSSGRLKRPTRSAVTRPRPAPDRPASPLRVFHWDPSGCSETLCHEVDECLPILARPGYTWVDLDDVPDDRRLKQFRSLCALDRMAARESGRVQERARYESHAAYDFLLLRMVHGGERGRLESEYLGIYFTDRWLITVQERPGDGLNELRRRLREGSGELWLHGADRVVAELVNEVVEGCFPLVERVGDRLEALEEAVLGPPDRRVVQRLHDARRSLLLLRRAVWPLRDALAQAGREPHGRLSPESLQLLRGVHDHAVQLLDLVENYREIAAGLVELCLSTVGARTNEVMKVLAIISTIFLPLTFIAGVYGMNFDTRYPLNMPELGWPQGYLGALGLMAACAVAMVAYFWRKGWLTKSVMLGEEETGWGPAPEVSAPAEESVPPPVRRE